MNIGGTSVNVVRQVAEGGYAHVFIVKTSSNEILALKRIVCTSNEVEQDAKTELKIFNV